MPFRDRSDAGRRLGEALKDHRLQRPVVFALPRGGVPVAAAVCAALAAPLDLVIARKIGVPVQSELAMGALAEGGAPVRNRDVIALAGVTDAEFAAVGARERFFNKIKHCRGAATVRQTCAQRPRIRSACIHTPMAAG